MTGGQTGLTRLLQPSLATEFSWLAPVAVIGPPAGLWLTHRGPRTEANRAGAGSVAGQITAWVQAHYTPTTIDDVQVYDLTAQPRV
jgi:hypothetical protein